MWSDRDDDYNPDYDYEAPLSPAEESVLAQDRRAELEYGVGWCDF